jgi:hypothetical protein
MPWDCGLQRGGSNLHQRRETPDCRAGGWSPLSDRSGERRTCPRVSARPGSRAGYAEAELSLHSFRIRYVMGGGTGTPNSQSGPHPAVSQAGGAAGCLASCRDDIAALMEAETRHSPSTGVGGSGAVLWRRRPAAFPGGLRKGRAAWPPGVVPVTPAALPPRQGIDGGAGGRLPQVSCRYIADRRPYEHTKSVQPQAPGRTRLADHARIVRTGFLRKPPHARDSGGPHARTSACGPGITTHACGRLAAGASSPIRAYYSRIGSRIGSARWC